MLERIDLGKENVLGFRVDGKIDMNDIKESQNAILPELKSENKFNLYVEVTDDVSSVEPQAIAERVRFLFSNFGDIKKKVNKLAVVTDKNWLQHLTTGIYKLVPAIDHKSFAFEESEKAREWITDHKK